MPEQRFITTWRKPAPDQFDWDYATSDSVEDLDRLLENIKSRGVHQYHTYPIGDMISEKSSSY